MTDETMVLRGLLEKSADASFLREMIGFAAERLAQRRIISAWIGTAYAEADAEGAKRQWRTVADQLRPKVPVGRIRPTAALMDSAEEDVLAYMSFPAAHQAQLHSTDEIERGSDVAGIFPNEAAVVRLVGAILIEQSDEWATQRSRTMTLETAAAISDTGHAELSAVPA